MKHSNLWILAASVLVLSSCGGGAASSSSSVKGSSASSATTQSSSADKTSTTSQGQSSSQAASSSSKEQSSASSSEQQSSSSVSSSSSVTPVAEFKATIALTQIGTGDAVVSPKEDSGAYLLTVTPENLPTGKTLADCDFTFPGDSIFGSFLDLAIPEANKKQFVTNFAGVNDIKVGVKCGDDSTVAELKLVIAKDETKYTQIATPDDFMSKVLKATVGRFELAANLDLGGLDTNGPASSVTFNGVLDGAGHTVKNFVANPQADGTLGGLWAHVGSGLIRNLHLIGTENQTAGWGSLLGKEVQEKAVVEDCLFEATSTITPADWTWQRSGIFAGFLKGTIRNSIAVNKTANAQMLDVAPYASKTGAVIDNVYTATADAALIVPFDPNGGTADWSGTAAVTNLHKGMVWADSHVADYTLDNTIWTLADGKMPVLAHDGDTFVKAAAKLNANASTTSLTVGGSAATITAKAENFGGDVTYSFEGSAGYDAVISVAQNATDKNVFTVSPVAAGTASITIKATDGTDAVSAKAIEFTVTTPGSTPTYVIPENATEIADKAGLLAYFNKSAENTTKNAYLSADIDLGGEVINDIRMAGEYTAIFEGQGHKITNFTGSRPFFNILGAAAEIRNVSFICDDFTGSGFGTIAYMNSGKMKNVDATVIINSVGINSWGPLAFVGAGTFIDCDTTITINVGCNTLFAIARADSGSTFTNCTYFVDGTDGTVATAVAASAASGVTLRSSK